MMSDQHENANLTAPKTVTDKEWERKQRNREYRIAARREKRNRKADEKKQRKLNATILRRMTRNPDKYTKNAERNRLRDIEMERRKIQQEAVRQAQRLAAIHDQTGALFNVSPVLTTEDGTVITQEAFRRRQLKAAEKLVGEQEDHVEKTEVDQEGEDTAFDTKSLDSPFIDPTVMAQQVINPERLAQIDDGAIRQHRSKNQLRKLAKFEPRAPPPKPIIPKGISLFEGEEDWLSLWDLEDGELERRVIREKKRRAAARKALRVKQQSGKVERRMARDEKRKVYRDMKLEWKAIKEETTREKTRLKAVEDEESKRIAVHICDVERAKAMQCCKTLGFTLGNTPGVDEVKPRAMGMKGAEVDFDAIEKGNQRNEIKRKANGNRVDLSTAPQQVRADYIPTKQISDQRQPEEFIQLDVGEGQDFETLNYNHKLRRKLRRAIEHAEIEKEMLVRQRALDFSKAQGIDVPAILYTGTRAVNVRSQRFLENGTIETAKQERVRARVELAEFNTQMRVLRRQAKETATYAGLRKHAELTGRIPTLEPPEKLEFSEADIGVEYEGDLEATKIGAIHASALKRKRPRCNTESGSDSSSSEQNSLSSLQANDQSESTSSISVSSHSVREASKDNEPSINFARQVMIEAEADSTLKGHSSAQDIPPIRSKILSAADGNASRHARPKVKGTGADAKATWR